MAVHRDLSLYLKTNADLIVVLAGRVHRRPTGNAVHKLRVAIRRARAALWVLRRGPGRFRAKALRHSLRRLIRGLGYVRELDVAIKDAGSYHLNSSKLKTRKRVAERSLRKLTHPDKNRKLAARLKKLRNDADSFYAKPLFQPINTQMQRQLRRLLKHHVRSQVELHALRVTLKKIRYIFEAIGKPVDSLRDTQETLGQAHDLEMLETLTGTTGTNRQLAAEYERLRVRASTMARPAILFVRGQLRTP